MRQKLSSKQLDRISEIVGNLGIVFLGSIIAPVFSGSGLNIFLVFIGLLLATYCFYLSFPILTEKK